MLHSAMNNGRTFGPRSCVNSAPALTTTRRNRAMADEPYKTCSRCGVEKPTTDFSPDARATTGLQPACRNCCSAASKARRDANIEAFREKETAYYHSNKERILANNAASRARCHEKVKAGKKAWYDRIKKSDEWQAREKERRDANKAAKSAYDREYRARDPQKTVERANKWRKANPEKRAAIIHNYSARRRAQESGGITTAALAAWVSGQKKVCYWCGCKCAKGFHVDHYVPLSKGGAHEAHNLVIACGPCNLKKNAKDPLDFAREVGRLF